MTRVLSVSEILELVTPSGAITRDLVSSTVSKTVDMTKSCKTSSVMTALLIISSIIVGLTFGEIYVTYMNRINLYFGGGATTMAVIALAFIIIASVLPVSYSISMILTFSMKISSSIARSATPEKKSAPENKQKDLRKIYEVAKSIVSA